MELYRPSLKNILLTLTNNIVHDPQRWDWDFNIFGKETIRVDCSFNGEHYVFLTNPTATDWIIIPGHTNMISTCVLDMMKLFFMDEQSIKKNPKLCCFGIYFVNHSMNYSFAENIFYILILRLAAKHNTKTMKKILSTYLEKYKLLTKTDCLLPELSIEISRYFIYFIFFDEEKIEIKNH